MDILTDKMEFPGPHSLHNVLYNQRLRAAHFGHDEVDAQGQANLTAEAAFRGGIASGIFSLRRSGGANGSSPSLLKG